MKERLLLFFTIAFLSSCSVYRSPERKEFESDSPQFRAQNLSKVSCSNSSARSKASASRLITVYKSSPTSDNQFLWEYIIDQNSVFESDNLGGVYCAFQHR